MVIGKVKETIVERDARLELESVEAKALALSEAIRTKIREVYSVDEEFKLLNLGIADNTNEKYLAYRTKVDEIKLAIKEGK